jgi:glycosyltransferase involved in cell wall biosynthesis
MNILILVESTSESNSAYHVANVAVRLRKLGHLVNVLFDSLEAGQTLSILKANQISFGTLGDSSSKVDVIYAWGARLKIRLITNLYECNDLIVHLEDNDYLIARNRNPKDFVDEWNDIDAFIDRAILVTALNRNCRELVPQEKPFVLLIPGVDDIFFESEGQNRSTEKQTQETQNYLLFTGNVTEYVLDGLSTIASAIESHNKIHNDHLFLFITGKDWTGSLKMWHPTSVLTGNFLDRHRLFDLMNQSLANIQCSATSEFDRFRFPSKIPEYLISNSVLLTTPFEIEFPLIDGENCVLVQDFSLELWAVCVSKVVTMSRDERAEMIGKAGVQAREKLSWSTTVQKLQETLNATSATEDISDRFKQDKVP